MFRILFAILLLIPTNGWCITQWTKGAPASGDSLTAWPAASQANNSVIDTLVSNYRRGMAVIYKNSTTITVTTGEVVASNSGGSVRLFLQLTSNTDATTANLDTGSSFSTSTQYYVYAGTSTATASSPTLYVSLSSTAPTGVTYYLGLGSFTTDSSGNIVSQKVYEIPNGNSKVDSSGLMKIQGIYDYGSSASSSTLKTGGLLIVYGQTTNLTSGSSFNISNLPFSSSSSYSIVASPNDVTTSNGANIAAIQSSGSAATIRNNENVSHTCNWMAIGT